MSVEDYSEDPNANTNVSDVFVGEGCAPGNINNAIRQIMADIAGGLVQYYAQTKTNAQKLIARQNIGLGNVNNTSDSNKPVSSATQNALNLKVNNSDTRMTNAREWTAATVSVAEAEAGTATTRRAWTAQRVRQAIRALAIGEGQTWVNMIGSRNPGVAYYNGTGRSIMVAVTADGHPSEMQVSANGSTWLNVGKFGEAGYVEMTVSIVIPHGYYYRTTTPINLLYWVELR